MHTQSYVASSDSVGYNIRKYYEIPNKRFYNNNYDVKGENNTNNRTAISNYKLLKIEKLQKQKPWQANNNKGEKGIHS